MSRFPVTLLLVTLLTASPWTALILAPMVSASLPLYTTRSRLLLLMRPIAFPALLGMGRHGLLTRNSLNCALGGQALPSCPISLATAPFLHRTTSLVIN